MSEVGAARSFLPWVFVVAVVVLAGAGYLSLDRKINALQATSAAKNTSQSIPELDHSRQTLGRLEGAVQDSQASQQKLADQVANLQRRIAEQDSERKLLSDQLGSLSARVDSLASAHATVNNQAPVQNVRRGRR
jgi:septal ring factor EnvC (AmiA/AmiB activator)